MAKPGRSLLTPQSPLTAHHRPVWLYLSLAVLSYGGLHQLNTSPPVFSGDWEFIHHPSVQEAAAVLRYLLPALFSGVALASLVKQLSGESKVFPWWLALLLAVGSYLVCNALSNAALHPQLTLGAGITQWLRDPVIQNTSAVLQYLLPAIFLLALILKPRAQSPMYAQLFESVANPRSRQNLENITWREFEQLVAETFRRRGFAVAETQHGADGGVDLIISKQNKTYLVQCKQWKAFKVGVNIVRELYGVMAAEGAIGGYVVTCGQFTDQARAFAEGLELHLIDGAQLSEWISGSPAKAPRAATPQATIPLCPTCKAPMRKRVVKQGAKAGRPFWGCSHYPKCRGTRPL